MIRASGGGVHLDGRMRWSSKMTSPVNSAKGYWELLKNLHREEYVAAHATNGAFWMTWWRVPVRPYRM